MSGGAPLVSPHAGVVTALEGDVAVVRFQRSEMCSRCGACLAIGEKELETRVANTLNAKVGDLVEVRLAGNRILQASALAYVVPLLLLLVGVWLGSRISDLFALLLGVGGCAVAFLVLRWLERKRRLTARFAPRMCAILRDEADGEG